MKIIKRIVCLFLSLISIFILSACETNDTENENIVKETAVIDIFEKNAVLDTDNCYRFRKYNNLNNISFSYCFTYSPSNSLYNCNVLVTTVTNITLYDYAAISFSWGKFKNGYFYAYHELENTAKIEFSYSNIIFNSNSLGNTYSYDVISNTFSNLTNKTDIDSYCADSYDCLEQALSYAQSLLSKYCGNYNLW